MIESYTFGKMVIDGKGYTKDVLILQDGTIVSPWWRKQGHSLVAQDIETVLESPPDTLLIGTGSPGMLKPDEKLLQQLKNTGMDIIVMPTDAAYREYNRLAGQSRTMVAGFHLTC